MRHYFCFRTEKGDGYFHVITFAQHFCVSCCFSVDSCGGVGHEFFHPLTMSYSLVKLNKRNGRISRNGRIGHQRFHMSVWIQLSRHRVDGLLLRMLLDGRRMILFQPWCLRTEMMLDANAEHLVAFGAYNFHFITFTVIFASMVAFLRMPVTRHGFTHAYILQRLMFPLQRNETGNYTFTSVFQLFQLRGFMWKLLHSRLFWNEWYGDGDGGRVSHEIGINDDKLDCFNRCLCCAHFEGNLWSCRSWMDLFCGGASTTKQVSITYCTYVLIFQCHWRGGSLDGGVVVGCRWSLKKGNYVDVFTLCWGGDGGDAGFYTWMSLRFVPEWTEMGMGRRTCYKRDGDRWWRARLFR